MSNSPSIVLAFNHKIALQFKSADVAVVYNHILFWLKNNESKGINQIDGKTWMYETSRQMADHFGYMDEQVVKRCLVKLVDAGYLIRDCKSKNAFDRTSWYALPDSNKVFDGSEMNIEKVQNQTLYNEDKQEDKQELLCSPSPEASEIENISEIRRKDYKGNSVLVRKSDLVAYSLKKNKDYSMPEIEMAWKIIVGYEKISSPFELMEGIIKKSRTKTYTEEVTKKITKEKAKCQSQRDSDQKKPPSISIREPILEKDTSERPLLNWKEMLNS